MTSTQDIVIQQTKTWIDEIVIALNLCPFAGSVFDNQQIDYIVAEGDITAQHLQQLATCFSALDTQAEIETSLLIFPSAYRQFDDYLELLHLANLLLDELNYTGTYQLASFHPRYQFAHSTETDAGNFTNRSPYPMLHILRESSIEQAISNFDDIENVPSNNIDKLRQAGFETMSQKLSDISSKDK